MNTCERITEAALELFSRNGYNGTSVRQIAEAVGIKDASLYKHFKSKQEILGSIVELIKGHISELSERMQLPGDASGEGDEEFYGRIDTAYLKKLTKDAFLFYLTDPYISRFWRLAHIEQYGNEEIYRLFRQIFIEDALAYLTGLFESMSARGLISAADPEATAMSYYAPFFLLLTKYGDQQEKTGEALALLDVQTDEFLRLYQRKGER